MPFAFFSPIQPLSLSVSLFRCAVSTMNLPHIQDL